MSTSEWPVGILFSTSGVTSLIESNMANATILAIEEINAGGGVLGKPLRYVHYDPESSPRQYKALAIRLLEEKVKIIFGCYMSSCRKAVLPEVEAHRGLLFYPVFYEGFEYSPRCFYTGAVCNQGAVQLASYVMRQHGPRILLIGSNYVFPYASNRVITDFVTQSGGKIVDEIYVPVEARMQDFKRFRKQVETLKPDAIISTVVGHGVQMLYEAYADAGFDPETMPIASTTTTEAEISAMKPGVATGHLSSLPFFDTISTEAAVRFIEAYKRRFGPDAPVNAAAEAAYFQVYIYAKALAAAGTDDPDEIVKRVEGIEYDAPQGRVRVDAGNHHTDLWPRIGKINSAGRFDLVWESKVSVRPDPYFVAASSDEWSSDLSVLSV